ncbi:Glycosyltransferase [Cordyceps fumosorosea ARSEF 2679]|uniref:Glycosyltransferase n=1 Tax=Cordyceps fumosorosea (strain ARSEF 2679) TaxID=1081104 RepID=A0A168B567_CORFA|nr:Glycosyltransferase [Cordyceps fumosorosea ARSEF 2679]OAA69631.1 Glycosyltransferase [Cordyceps fumosorosea ARSEF 2679]
MPLGCFKRASRLVLLAVGVGAILSFLLLHHALSPSIASPERIKDAADTVDHCELSKNNTNPRIPNKIHQIWKDKDLSTYPLTASTGAWESKFENTNYTIRLWTEADIVNLVKSSYPWFLSTYESYKYNIQRADVARLMVVHHEGGIYADLDAYPSLDTSAETISCLQNLGYQAILAPTSEDRGISNHFFMAERDSEFLLWALHEAKKRAGSLSGRFMLPYVVVFWSTGPLMITSVMNQYAWLYNQASEIKSMAVLKDSFLHGFVHHAAGRSWHGSDGRALNYIADHFTEVIAPVLLFLVAAATAIVVARRWGQIRPRIYNIIRPSQV